MNKKENIKRIKEKLKGNNYIFRIGNKDINISEKIRLKIKTRLYKGKKKVNNFEKNKKTIINELINNFDLTRDEASSLFIKLKNFKPTKYIPLTIL